jgi:hypothetical protein
VISLTIGIAEGERVEDYLEAVNYLLRNTIRHELEHHAQLHDKFRIPIDRKAIQKLTNDAGLEYFLLPHEIEAFSRGLYAEAKARKLSFSQVAREAADKYQASAIERGIKFSNLDKERIIIAWENYAKKHTPKAKIIEPDYMDESRFMSYQQFMLNESKLIHKTIWKIEKKDGLESIASKEYKDEYVERFLRKIKEANPTSSNLVQIALSALEPVTVEDREGPLYPNRCFLSSLHYMKENEDKVEIVVGILRRKGSYFAWVHAFNKEGEKYFDKSLKSEEFSQYEHYLISTVIAKKEDDIAKEAWIFANSLQKSAEEYRKYGK